MFIHSAQFAKWESFEPIKIILILFPVLKTLYFSHLFFYLFLFLLYLLSRFLTVIVFFTLFYLVSFYTLNSYTFLEFLLLFFYQQATLFQSHIKILLKITKKTDNMLIKQNSIINACRLSISTSSMAASLYVSFST